MKYNLPIVIPKRRTQTVGGARSSRETLSYEVEKQGQSDLVHLLRQITIEETEKQEKLGNPPSAIAVDSNPAKPLNQATKKTEVTFGATMQKLIIAQVEIELAKAISKVTTTHTGELKNIKQNWAWFYSEGARAPYRRVSPLSLKSIAIDARLALAPINAEAAEWANIFDRRPPKNGYAQVKGRERRAHSKGFMAIAANRLRRNRIFKTTWSVYAIYSKSSAFRATRYKYGVPVMIVRPAIKTKSRFRR